jgi:hypothetical protein
MSPLFLLLVHFRAVHADNAFLLPGPPGPDNDYSLNLNWTLGTTQRFNGQQRSRHTTSPFRNSA